MYNFGDILTVNTRRLKKFVKQIQPQGASAIASTYVGKFVVMEDSLNGNLVCIQHAPEYPELHHRTRNVPTSLVRRIRKGNPEHAKLLEVK